MIKGFIGKVQTLKRPLFNRVKFNFMNEVPKFDPSKDYYRSLGVNKQSSDSDIKRAYYGLAKKYHPDSNPGYEGKFKEINEAYSVLSDTSIKRQYDSARVMRGFSDRMSSKANQGTWNYQEYQAEYTNMSAEEQEQLRQEINQKLRKVAIFGIVMIVVLPFITRRNHRYYILNNGELMPVEF